MTTQMNKQPASDARTRALAHIASLADWIECEVQKDTDGDVAWATVNTLEDVRDQLIEVLALFARVPRTEIERSLEELHS